MAHWQQIKLGEISQIYSGFAFRSQDLGRRGIPVLKIANIQNKCVSPECAHHLPEEFWTEKLNRYVLHENDILIAMTGAGSVGKVGKMPRNTGRFLVNQRVAIVRPYSSRCVPAFVYFALSQDCYETKLYSLGLGAGQPNVSANQIGELELPCPPLPVQQRIADILSAYDELIENNQRRIRILESMARALYREWFVHFRFPGHENHARVASPLGEIPQGWEVKLVKDVAAVTYGFPFQSGKFNTGGVGTPVIRIRDILVGASVTFTEEVADSKYHVKNGHILVGMDGDFHMNIWSSGHAYQNQRVARFDSQGEIGNFHLFLALEKPIQEFNKAIVGTTVAHLGDMHIKTIQIVWPPEDIRSKAREFLEPLSQQVITLKQQIANLRRTRDLLLPRLLSGQIDVTPPEP